MDTNLEREKMTETKRISGIGSDPSAKKVKASDKPVEAKDAKFRRLAVRRVPAAVRRLQQIANLGNRNQYCYNEEQVCKIMTALHAALKAVEIAFAGKKDNGHSFTL